MIDSAAMCGGLLRLHDPPREDRELPRFARSRRSDADELARVRDDRRKVLFLHQTAVEILDLEGECCSWLDVRLAADDAARSLRRLHPALELFVPVRLREDLPLAA